MKNSLILLLSLSLYLIPTSSKAYDVEFGETEKSGKKTHTTILGKSGDFFYVYKVKYMALGVQEHKLVKYDPESIRPVLEAVIDIDTKNFRDIAIFSNKIVIFLNEKDKNAGMQRLYYNIYNLESLKLEKPNQEVAKFELIQHLFHQQSGNFKVLESRDKSKFGVFYNLPYDKGSPEKFGYTIYNQNFEQLSGQEFVMPVNDELINLDRPYISNAGRFYLSAQEVSDKKLFKKPEKVTRHIFEVDINGELIDYKIELPGKFISEYTFDVNDDDDLICSGFYGDVLKSTISGVVLEHFITGAFYIRIDGKKQNIVEENYQNFDNYPSSDCVIRDMISLKDGSTILTAEEYYVTIRTYTDAQGNSKTTYTYHYNDIFVLKINNKGEFDWYSEIPKLQVSTNDKGYYSSYSFHYDDEKLYFMFNDNMKNYSDGNVVGGKTYSTSFSSNKKNVTSLVSMNISDGKFKKAKLFGKADLMTIAVPKIHFSDPKENTLYIFGKRSKDERLGRIKF